MNVSVRLCRPDRNAYSAKSALGHPDHLKTRLRPLPCSGRPLSAIWNCMCGSRHVRTYLARIAKGFWGGPQSLPNDID